MEIEEFRKRLELFHESLHRQLYLFYSGRQPSLQLSSVYSEYSDLFSDDAIRELRTHVEKTPDSFPSRKRSFQKLHAFAIAQNIVRSTAALIEELAESDSKATIHWGEEDVPLRDVPLRQAAERDSSRRRRLDELRCDVTRRSESLRQELVRERSSHLRSLGYQSYLEAVESCSGVDYGRLSRILEAVIDATEADYNSRLNASLNAGIGIERTRAHTSDLPYWKSRYEPQGTFASAGARHAVEKTFNAMGLVPEVAGALATHAELRPARQTAICIPLRIPGEIKIVMRPRGGHQDYRALLHQNGHGHHYAWTSGSLPAEDRLQGDRAVRETFASLFEHLILSKGWLRDRMGFIKSAGFLSFQGLLRAYTVRRFAARLRFDLLLWGRSRGEGTSEAYAQIMKDFTGVGHEPDDYLQGVEQPLWAGDCLRGWMLEAMFSDYLRVKFGNEWYAGRSAGDFLKQLWETGQLYSADQLSNEIGLGPLDPQALTDALRAGLR